MITRGKAGEGGEPEQMNTNKTDRREGGIGLRTASIFFSAAALLAAIALFISDYMVTQGYRRMEQASDNYISSKQAASDLEAASDYLTDRARCFVVTGDMEYLEDYFAEAEVNRRRDNALAKMEELADSSDSAAYQSLAKAMDYSNELMDREYQAMAIMLGARNYTESQLAKVPDVVRNYGLSAEEQALDPAAKQNRAQGLVFDGSYMGYKEKISGNVTSCTEHLIEMTSEALEQATSRMDRLLRIQTLLTVAFLVIVLALVFFITSQVRVPLTRMVELMREQRIVPTSGASELRFVTRTYNEILAENKEHQEKLAYEATHDPLTGLYNRGAYEMFMQTMDADHIGLLLVDVDKFKLVNDTYGHDVGDRVLKRVAESLRNSFRSVDIICRIGGDEFVVIMTRASDSMHGMVVDKIAQLNAFLQEEEKGLPPTSLSVGVAFADRKDPAGDIFRDADTALYHVKRKGRCGCAVYGYLE